ncbi:MAG TPA: Uma2 family endonuclease, partial [Acidimicrobiia bacterium]|nr:Uma2 family endonuclease [Acidimicrobiia bacterium]
MPSAPFTYEDVLAMPEDGRRYELFDGTLIVTPAPARRHQLCVSRLLEILAPLARAAGCDVLPGPIDVRLAPDRILEPDLIVVTASTSNEQTIDEVPRLVVEVASPSTQAIDRDLKRRAYEERGVPAYWLVDPADPSLTVLELEAGRYVERAPVIGDAAYETQLPFAVTRGAGRPRLRPITEAGVHEARHSWSPWQARPNSRLGRAS